MLFVALPYRVIFIFTLLPLQLTGQLKARPRKVLQKSSHLLLGPKLVLNRKFPQLLLPRHTYASCIPVKGNSPGLNPERISISNV